MQDGVFAAMSWGIQALITVWGIEDGLLLWKFFKVNI